MRDFYSTHLVKQFFYPYLCPTMMRSNCFKYIMMSVLLLMYINRGLFVAMPSVEIPNPFGNEINSLLEVIIIWAGGDNSADEDGDSPETYNAAQTIQPLIDPNSMFTTCLMYPNSVVHKVFYLHNETILSQSDYGTIDHPPQQA